MLLGYEIADNDNDDYFLADEEQLPKEWVYKNTYEYDQLPASLKMKKRKIDIGSTHDGFTIVSKRFKSLCEQHNFKGLEFRQLPADVDFYLFKVHNVLAFDAVARKTKYIKASNEFNGYAEIIGATPVCLKNKKPVPEGTLFRTDIFFGSGIRKSPVLMTGIATRKLMDSWKLKGIYFNEILDEYPWQKEPAADKPRNLFKRLFK